MGEIWDSEAKVFNQQKISILMKYISGNSSADISTLDTIIEGSSSSTYNNSIDNSFNAEKMRAKTLSAGSEGVFSYSKKTSSQDINVMLGDLNWTVTFLSKSKNDDIILTLFLNNTYQKKWAETKFAVFNPQTTMYGFSTDSWGLYGPYSSFSAGEALSSSYHLTMYGTSIIRAYALCNGGYYTSDGATLTSAYAFSGPFSDFTRSRLTKYLEVPRNMPWQETGTTLYQYQNAFWGESNWDSDYYDTWADDYVWLPSLYEIGQTWGSETSFASKEKYYNIWGTSNSQKEDAMNYWTRNTGSSVGSNYAYVVGSSSVGNTIGTNVWRGIRPCVHLNLTKAITNMVEERSPIYGDIYDLNNSQPNYDNLDIMYKYLAGSSTATFSNITVMANNVSNATTFRAKTLSAGTVGDVTYLAKTAGENITVKFAGYYWEAVYLSKDKNGNVILTLWMDNKYQKEFVYSDTNTSSYMGINGRLYVTTVGGYRADAYYRDDDDEQTTLNLTTGLFDYLGQDLSTSPYLSVFLGYENSLYNYLTTPKQMAWQEVQLSKEILGMPYNLSNESWSTTLSNDGFYSANNNYANISGSDAWADGYLWLPSLSEIGYSGTNGLWGVSSEQRACTSTSTGEIGYYEDTIVNNTWTRSANYKQSYGYYFIKSSGDGKGVGASYARVIRPCVHIDLTAMEADR